MKADIPGLSGVGETLHFVRAFGGLLAAALVCGLLSLASLRRGEREATQGARAGEGEYWPAPVLALGMALPWLAYNLKIVHELGFEHRFSYPIVPVLAFGLTAGLQRLLSRVPRFRGRGLLAWSSLALALLVLLPRLSAARARLERPPPSDPYTSMFLRLGAAIHDSGLSDRIVLVCTHAGATPFAARAHHVDPAGLVDDGFCRRTPKEERVRYQSQLQPDVVSWHLFPASPGASTLDDDPRARGSAYINQWCLGLPEDMDASTRQGLADMDLAQRKEHTFKRMLYFRENATLVGEMWNGVRRWRTFVYVMTASPYHDLLVDHLSKHVDIPSTQVDCDGWPP